MVDYTQAHMRDETWRRWKGGQKLADELRAFYTSKNVFDRLGQSVPLAPVSGRGKGNIAAGESPRWMRSGFLGRHSDNGNDTQAQRLGRERFLRSSAWKHWQEKLAQAHAARRGS